MFQHLIEKYHDLQAKRENGEGGFTLIELLVVVVIIGILIAIAIPLYLNYQTGAHNKAAQSDVRNAVSAAEQCISDNNTVPATATGQTASFALCTGRSVNVSDGTKLSFTKSTDGKSYVIVARNSDGDTSYKYDSTVGGPVKSTTDNP